MTEHDRRVIPNRQSLYNLIQNNGFDPGMSMCVLTCVIFLPVPPINHERA